MLAMVLFPAVGVFLGACALDQSATGRGSTTTVVDLEHIETIAGEVTFGEVRQIVPYGEVVWVLDRQPPFVARVALVEGAGVGEAIQFGVEGSGPGELRQPVALVPTEAGVDVFDLVSGKRVSFSASGQIIAVHALSDKRSGWIRPDMAEVSHLDPWRVRAIGEVISFGHYPVGLTHPTDFLTGSIVWGRPDMEPLGTIVDYGDRTPRDSRSLGQFPATPLWDACEDVVVVWDPRSEQVIWFGADGLALDSAWAHGRRAAITTEDIESFLAAMVRHELPAGYTIDAATLRRRAREVRPVFGKIAPMFGDLRCGPDGSAWLQSFDLKSDPLGSGAKWLHIRPNTDATAVEFPLAFHPHAFRSGSVLGVQDVPEGEVLARWEVAGK